MRKIFFILLFLGLLKVDNLWADSLLSREAEKYYQQGKKELSTGNLIEAKKFFQKAVAINPDLRDAYYQLAKIAEIQGCPEQAEEAYQKVEYKREIVAKPGGVPSPKEEAVSSSCPECEHWQIIKEAKAWEKEIIGEKETFQLPEQVSLKEAGAIEGVYTGIEQRDLYKAERKGPPIASRFDPYHPEHKD
ncbi:MAG: hypothetical protein AB7E08_06670, partial [Candidatus Omnitrophota bacterium]